MNWEKVLLSLYFLATLGTGAVIVAYMSFSPWALECKGLGGTPGLDGCFKHVRIEMP